MGEQLSAPKVTLGADPEFILCERGNPNKIVLFSSQHTNAHFGLSAAELGADYGLLELHPKPQKKPKKLVKELRRLQDKFTTNYPDLMVVEKEAVEYDHKKARILEALNADKQINYGMGRGKDLSVWSSGSDIITGLETGQKLSAYNEPIFSQYNAGVLTAGGHLHIGGRYMMMLSLEQTKGFVRRLQEEVFPLCQTVETVAAALRRTAYGNKGEFCIKPYGIEWRVPANSLFWPKNRETLSKVLKKIKKLARSYALLATKEAVPMKLQSVPSEGG